MTKTGAQHPRPARPVARGPIRPVVTAVRAVWVFTATAVQVCFLGNDANL